MSKFVLKKVNSGFKFDLKASNGQVIASSEVYNTRSACLKGVESIRKSAPVAGIENLTEPDCVPCKNPKFELFQDKAGEFRFRLRSRNGKIIAVSEGYTTKASCLNGIDSVKKNADLAELEDV